MRVPAVTLFTLAIAASTARAESNEYNLHLGFGVYAPTDVSGLGGEAAFDYQFKPGFALDFALSYGSGSSDAFGNTSDSHLATMIGMRFRFVDDYRGYLNEPRGNALGNLWVTPRVGLIFNNRCCEFGDSKSHTAFGISGEVGYEFSVIKPVQVGAFVRIDLPMIGDLGTGLYALAGLNISAGFGRPARVLTDQDRDGVDDKNDACPDTPPDTEVDSRGCTILRAEMVLHGIRFALDRAEIEPGSEPTLKGATQALRDNPHAEVEIGGHTDDTGTVDHNQQLSTARAQAVADWLFAHGISRDQITVKGYGSTVPKATNDTEEHRALNRRIEFKRLH